ncbi:MAG: aminoacyl-tRNA hydrolase [Sedimentisphaerales bacterium]|nr:aminoacyl-tRNA hydrolase [Sedimentisphaerales bacterium]
MQEYSDVHLLVGLGNPGRQYETSRHNVGFRVIDLLGRRWRIELTRQKHEGLLGEGRRQQHRIILLKPQTYMNRSGQSVRAAVQFYRVAPQRLLVIVDDFALELGRLRLRTQGSAGGHNGLEDIIAQLGEEFSRLRVGIGSARPGCAVAHVLGHFAPEEQPLVAGILERAADCAECWLRDGAACAMERFNRTPGEHAGEEQTESSPDD